MLSLSEPCLHLCCGSDDGRLFVAFGGSSVGGFGVNALCCM